MVQVFATSQRRMRSAIWPAVASGTLVEYLPSRRAQYRRPISCRTSSMRCVGPPRFFRQIQMSIVSLDFSGYDSDNGNPELRLAGERILSWMELTTAAGQRPPHPIHHSGRGSR